MKAEPQNRLSKRQVLALRGIRLPALALHMLQQTGIYCDPTVSLEYQNLVKRYVIRGCESGGAAGHMGAYCGFVDTNGETLPWLSRVDAVGRNGLHAVVVAPELVRIQIFRNGLTCVLLVTRHELKFENQGRRPTLESTILFHGTQGTLPQASCPDDVLSQDEVLPIFHTRSGESLLIPENLRVAVQRTVEGSLCPGCHHCHLSEAEVKLPHHGKELADASEPR
jgi:hypothetical protein